jgi:hypothetical protein
MLQVDPREIGRLAELVKNLEDRLEEAEIHGWSRENEGIKPAWKRARPSSSPLGGPAPSHEPPRPTSAYRPPDQSARH